MLAMVAKIVFFKTSIRDEITFTTPHSVEITSSYKLLTDRAEIVLPRNASLKGKNVSVVFRKGDKVEIFLGYNGNLFSEFSGYITQVSSSIPIKITLEDEMWKLKQLGASISLKQASLPTLLGSIVPGQYSIDALEISLGSVRYPNTTIAKILDSLKKEFSLFSYMKKKTLVVGKVFADDLLTIEYKFGERIIGNTLQFNRGEDVKIKLVAVNTAPNGDTIKIKVGDPEGELRQISYYNLPGKKELERLALIDLKKAKADGYKGEIITFGAPYIHHGTKVRILDSEYPEREGTYYTEQVKTVFNSSPKFHRYIQLAGKA